MPVCFWKENKRRRRFLRKALCGLFLGALLGTAACGKGGEEQKEEKPTQEGTLTPTEALPEAAEGFDAANQELVQKKAKEYAETVVVSVGEEDIAMDKAVFLIYSMEVRGNYYALYYESQYGTNYWDMVYDDEGHTTRDVFKQETMDMLVQYAVLYDCALKNDMTLTEDDIAENNAYVERIKEALTAEETERGGFTTEGLREVCAWMMLAEKYYNQMTERLGVTKESVRETVKKEDYKEYETEYLYLATTYYDENYELRQEEMAVKEACMQQMEEYYKEVLEGKTFEELAEGEDAPVRNIRTFLADGASAEEAYKKAAESLEPGEVSKPVQTEYGVYLIKMLDNECTKTYEAAVDAAYEVERSNAFAAAYDVLLAEYPVQINEAVWDEVLFGATVSLSE